jgi:D-alanyl-D-alanine carboxypeptidase (penicillin-binding protein 5/6)
VPPPPQIQGKAWVLMDYATGQVIAGEHYDDRKSNRRASPR